MDTQSRNNLPPRKKRRWGLRIGLIVALCVVVAVLAALGSSYWWFSAQVGTANERVEPETEEALATPPPTTLVKPPVDESQEAEDILILGSDTRGESVAEEGRSDVIMLLHVDRALRFASLLSIPRDLYVDIPGVGKDKINAAYAHGRAALSIKTIKQVFGVDVTKYLEIGFAGFEQTVDALGGVYVDVDRNYSPDQTNVAIDAGYRRLSGKEAVGFARFRKDQNYDFGRMARQQRVLAGLREQAMTWNLPFKLPGVVKSALGSTATNLTTNEILSLAYWLVRLEGSRLTQIVLTGPTAMIEGKSVVLADENALKDAVLKFLTPPDYAPRAESQPEGTYAVESESKSFHTVATAGPLIASSTGLAVSALPDAQMWHNAQRSVPFPLRAPSYLPEGFHYLYTSPRQGTYQIEPGDDSKLAVRMVYQYGTKDLYLGVSATNWTDAPLATKGQEVTIDGTTYTVVGTSNKVHHVWWKADGVLYFVSNTLMHTLSKDELLKIAASTVRVDQGAVAVAEARVGQLLCHEQQGRPH